MLQFFNDPIDLVNGVRDGRSLVRSLHVRRFLILAALLAWFAWFARLPLLPRFSLLGWFNGCLRRFSGSAAGGRSFGG
jgi:hypothetical protein